jgi:5'-methylthioadenosine phosphorylase
MLAIIGGTGLYHLEGLRKSEQIVVDTPFGECSAPVTKAYFVDKEILFLPRHGYKHNLLPHEINYRANIFALKKLGAKQVISVSAAGSLREDIHPGEFVVPCQYFDFIKGNREKTFFGEGLVAHVSTAQPVCSDLTEWINTSNLDLDLKMHMNKTYACVDGPRLGTKAESFFLRNSGCDIVGMTNVPEVFLAREAQICYTTIALVTDYDCWKQDSSQHVSVDNVISCYQKSLETAKKLLSHLLSRSLPTINEGYRRSLDTSILSDNTLESKRELLSVLRV